LDSKYYKNNNVDLNYIKIDNTNNYELIFKDFFKCIRK